MARYAVSDYSERQQMKIEFGVMVNDMCRCDMVFRQSEIPGEAFFIKEPESATKGLNRLLDLIEEAGADIAVLAHQDMYFRAGWVPQVKEQVRRLPDNWIVAGVVGKDMRGRIAGKFHDMRIPQHFDTSDIHDFPVSACCFDECVIIVNIKSGFRFDEKLKGFDLYGTLCVLQTWERGGTAWVIDAYCEHFCLRPFSWFPPKTFQRNYKWLYNRFKNAERLDTTVLGVPEETRIFATSAA